MCASRLRVPAVRAWRVHHVSTVLALPRLRLISFKRFFFAFMLSSCDWYLRGGAPPINYWMPHQASYRTLFSIRSYICYRIDERVRGYSRTCRRDSTMSSIFAVMWWLFFPTLACICSISIRTDRVVRLEISRFFPPGPILVSWLGVTLNDISSHAIVMFAALDRLTDNYVWITAMHDYGF